MSLVRELIDRGNRVAIGVETGMLSLSQCSLVLAPLSVGGADSGTIGVIGPTRMDYQKAMSAVALVGQQLSAVLSEHSGSQAADRVSLAEDRAGAGVQPSAGSRLPSVSNAAIGRSADGHRLERLIGLIGICHGRPL